MPGARSRKIRTGHRRRPTHARRHFVLVGSGALALALTSALSIASFSGVDVAGAAVARAQSIADLFARRSPGQRTEAHLTKTKHKHFAVLAERQEAPPVPAIEKPLVEAFLPPPAAPLIPEEIAGLEQSAPLIPAVFTPGPGGVFFSPCCGTGGPGGGGGPPPNQPPPNQPPPNQPPPNQPPPVPEPSTWAMIITGFGLTGFALRRRRAADRLSLGG
jgi:hypothetical protein